MAQDPQVIELLAGEAGQSIHSEALSAAGSTIVPGDLVEELAAGTVQENSTAAGDSQALFALSNLANGGDIDTAYGAGVTTRYGSFSAGQEVNARVAAAAPAIANRDKLESAGDGTLRKQLPGVQASLAVGAGNSQVLYTANQIGLPGNDITVEYLAATAATATVVVTDLAIVIKPDSTTGGTTDLASTVITLVNGDAAASALVSASVGAGDGTGIVVSPAAEANLAGGTGGTKHTAVALEAVDNSGGGTVVRIKARVA
jgi:hypothetical protein